MNSKQLDQSFLSFKCSELTFPFDQVTKVFKVKNKVFGLVSEVDGLIRINLKGIPEDNMALRGMFDSIKPGFHMNKEHWNSLYLDGSLNDDLIKRLISESYDIVCNKLTKKVRESVTNNL